LSAISPLTSIAYSIRNISLLAFIRNCPLTSIAYSIRKISLLTVAHNCQFLARLPALPTASGTSAYWHLLTIVSYQPTYQLAYSIKTSAYWQLLIIVSYQPTYQLA
jgi:hypothetical protein